MASGRGRFVYNAGTRGLQTQNRLLEGEAPLRIVVKHVEARKTRTEKHLRRCALAAGLVGLLHGFAQTFAHRCGHAALVQSCSENSRGLADEERLAHAPRRARRKS